MSLHQHAWRGQNIVILDKNLTEGLRLEQAIAAVSPNNEVIIETFADYSEAYDYCREKGNVGLFLISSQINAPVVDAIEQLSRFYQFFGTTPRAVLITDENENELVAYRIRSQQKKCFSTLKREEITDPVLTAELLNDLWSMYQQSIEAEFFPTALQDAFSACTSDVLESDSLVFMERVSVLLGSGLNLSWFDQIALKWAPVLNEMSKTNAQLLRTSEFIVNLSNFSAYSEIGRAAEVAKDKTIPLARRLATVVAHLDQERKKGSLPLAITQFSKLAKPGASAVYRHIQQKADQILSFAGMGNVTIQSDQNQKRTG